MAGPALAPLAPTATPEVVTDESTELDPGQHAHIVKTEPGVSAAAAVLEARVMGTPIEALCGYKWVPSKDPQRLPVCPACLEIYEMFKIFNEGLGDSPSA